MPRTGFLRGARGFLGLVVPSLVLAACGPAPQVETSEADVEAFQAHLDAFDAAVNVGDYEALAGLYDEAAIRMPDQAPAQVGNAAIREWFRLDAEQRDVEIDNVMRGAEVFGDWGFMWGDATGTRTPRDGSEATTIQSKWMAVMRRQPDGTWKTYRDIYNSDLPRSGG